ncbi:MAG: MlaC/ttg2D family ABC transporter substrate-binding protein [Parvibaculaceae bacterium]
MNAALPLRRYFAPLAFALTLVTTSFASMLPASAAAGDPAAEAFVNEISVKAIDIISDKASSRDAKETAFGELLDSHADMPKIAAFALGQYVRLPTPEQKAEYLKLVRTFVVKVYVTRLADYHNEKLVITGSQAKGANQALVDSQINFTNGREPVKVTWWLVKDTTGAYRIFDVNVVGIWLAQEQRSSFTSVIANNGGDFNALIKDLTKRVASAETPAK